MPSTGELQSISTLEAMAAGAPVVAADAMALPHLIDGTGYLFVPGNVKDLCEKLAGVLAAPEAEQERMRARSRALAGAHDIRKTLTAFETLYMDLIRRFISTNKV
jgi:glycosyltransferase involved in cell wall biosynthesis